MKVHFSVLLIVVIVIVTLASSTVFVVATAITTHVHHKTWYFDDQIAHIEDAAQKNKRAWEEMRTTFNQLYGDIERARSERERWERKESTRELASSVRDLKHRCEGLELRICTCEEKTRDVRMRLLELSK